MPSPPFHDPDFWAGDPYPALGALRAADPVHRYEGPAGSFWALSRHADVLAVSKDPHTFCSGRGVLLTDLVQPVLSTDSILYMDPPTHGRHRKLVSPSLTVRRVGALEERVRAITCGLLDDLATGEVVEVIDAFLAPIPLLVIAELIGVPTSDLPDFRRWSDATIAAATDRNSEGLVLTLELLGYIRDQVEHRRANPADDLLSILAHGEIDGERLAPGEIEMFVLSLLVAGNETTRTLLANGLVALDAHPDQQQLLADQPARIPVAVEELLRWEAPIVAFCRTATTDAEVAGTPVAAGDHVVMLYQSANRDESVFGPTADQFDVTRDPNPHTSFGYAEHYCLGAGLARLEARIVLEELLARWPELALAGPPERIPSRLVRGIRRLPVLLR